MPLERLVATAARHERRPLAHLGDERLHPVAALREDVGFALDLRREHAHGAERSGRGGHPPCNSPELDKPRSMTQSEHRVGLRIQVHPDAREELLEFLRRVKCEAHADGDDAVLVEVPDALGDEQARLEIDLYLKAWQASHPDVEAHLL
jgi:hypothetical protein